VTAVTIAGNPVTSFDISWVNPDRAEYYLSDRSNSGIDIIDTQHLKFKRTIGGFVGIVLNASKTAADNTHSGRTAWYPTAGGSTPATATARSR
jgi:hypothetical protein